MPTNVDIPVLGESVREAILIKWLKAEGDTVAKDEALCELETDKANVEVPSPAAGVFRKVTSEGATVKIGETVGRIDDAASGATNGAAKPTAPSAAAAQPAQSRIDDLSPATRRVVTENNLDPATMTGTGKDGRLTKEDAVRHIEASAAKPAAATPPPSVPTPAKAVDTKPAPLPSAAISFETDGTRRSPMSKIRSRIAKTLVEAQQTAAILSTFNEVDLSEVMAIRAKYKDQFEKTHKVGLGFMSFFARAIAMGLTEFPALNAFIDGTDIVYHNYVHLGVAVSTERGLVVPVLRNVQGMSFAKIESEIKRLAGAARDNKLGIPELSGGTFTVTNGGVFGSLLSTPILLPPQSGILGMHTIQKRPVAVGDKVEIRPMMYLALSYDHRLVDGKESVSFLVRVKQLLEDPARLMLEV